MKRMRVAVVTAIGLVAGSSTASEGRALDHIGFEVKNLEEFCKKLESASRSPLSRIRGAPTSS